MIVLGLTGSIGMGKTTVGRMLAEMGFAVHDSDAAARAAIGPGGVALDAVSAAFPEAFDPVAGAMDRAALGAIVFADPIRRRQLEEIVHPHVVASQQDFLKVQRAKGAKLAVLDIPLLYETGADRRVDCVAVVSCPAFMQRRRVLSRPGMTAGKLENVLRTQMPDHEKRRRADFVIQTGIGMGFTRTALRRMIAQLGVCSHDKNRNDLPPLSL